MPGVARVAPGGWACHGLVKEPMSARECEAVRTCIKPNRPFGSDAWKRQAANRLGLLHTLRDEGLPKRAGNGSTKKDK